MNRYMHITSFLRPRAPVNDTRKGNLLQNAVFFPVEFLLQEQTDWKNTALFQNC